MRAVADDHARSAGAHQVQRSLVVGAAADEHGHVEVGDERLEVETRRLTLRDVLGGDHRALDYQQIDTLGEHVRRELGGVLRGEPHRNTDARGAQLADPAAQQNG